MSSNIVAIVLAAGFSRRFGGPKLAATLTGGESVVARTLANIQPVCKNIVVVTSESNQGYLPAGKFEILIFDQAELGMGASLAFGIAHIKQQAKFDGCLVCLADMPFVQPAVYTKLMGHMTPHKIVLPTFEGRNGNPVGFGSEFFPALESLSGDLGGRELIRANPGAVVKVPIQDRDILQDIDTPEDLSRLIDG